MNIRFKAVIKIKETRLEHVSRHTFGYHTRGKKTVF